MKNTVLSFVALLITLTGSAQNRVQNITATDLEKAMQSNIILVDVRTPQEYNEGHLRNAVNIDWYAPTFMVSMNKFDKKTPVYLYCRSGSRSHSAADKLLQAGFINVYSLDGGINRWTGAGKPVLK